MDLAAHITGTVVKIEKSLGEPVLTGESVLVLESMKMEMPLESPGPGRVREIRCREGQAVTEGDVLVVLD